MPWALHGLRAQGCAQASAVDGLTGVQRCAPGGSSVRERALEGGRIVSLRHRCLLFLERIVLHRTCQHRLLQNDRQKRHTAPSPTSRVCMRRGGLASSAPTACVPAQYDRAARAATSCWVGVCVRLCGDLRLSLKVAHMVCGDCCI